MHVIEQIVFNGSIAICLEAGKHNPNHGKGRKNAGKTTDNLPYIHRLQNRRKDNWE